MRLKVFLVSILFLLNFAYGCFDERDIYTLTLDLKSAGAVVDKERLEKLNTLQYKGWVVYRAYTDNRTVVFVNDTTIKIAIPVKITQDKIYPEVPVEEINLGNVLYGEMKILADKGYLHNLSPREMYLVSKIGKPGMKIYREDHKWKSIELKCENCERCKIENIYYPNETISFKLIKKKEKSERKGGTSTVTYFMLGILLGMLFLSLTRKQPKK